MMGSMEIGSYQLGQEFPYTEPLRHSAQMANELSGLSAIIHLALEASVTV